MKEKTRSLAVSALLNTLAYGIVSNRHNQSALRSQAGKEFNKLLATIPKEQQQAMNNLRTIFVSLAEKLVDAPDPQQVALTAAYLQTVIDGEVTVAKEINLA